MTDKPRNRLFFLTIIVFVIDKKQKTLLGIIAILLLCIVVGFFFLIPSITFDKEKHVLERGELYRAEDIIMKANGTVTPEEEYIPTEEVGNKSFKYVVQSGPFKRTIEFKYEVKDTKPPVIELKEKIVEMNPGESLTEENVSQNVSINEGVLSFETDYNPYNASSYVVKVKAVDEFGNESSSEYEVIIKDVEEPTVFRTGNNVVIERGKPFLINEIISYGDNVDAHPTLVTEGEVNTAVAGEYPIHATLTDYSGNVMEWDFTVIVADQIEQKEHAHDYDAFEDVLVEHAGENRKFGIDVSTWQGDIDFEAVKEAGCEFVIIRIGFSHKGVFKVDEKYRQNIENAKAVGLPVGIYLFSYDNTEEYLVSSLEGMFEELGEESLELPIVFDWENFQNYQDYEMSFQMLNHLYDVFEREVTNRGYESMLYGSKYYLEHIWQKTDERPVWLALYTDENDYEGPHRIWQLSGTGRINGIVGNVDLDIMYGE